MAEDQAHQVRSRYGMAQAQSIELRDIRVYGVLC